MKAEYIVYNVDVEKISPRSKNVFRQIPLDMVWQGGSIPKACTTCLVDRRVGKKGPVVGYFCVLG